MEGLGSRDNGVPALKPVCLAERGLRNLGITRVGRIQEGNMLGEKLDKNLRLGLLAQSGNVLVLFGNRLVEFRWGFGV